MEPPQQL